jgi:hypothetical protein
MMAFLSDHWLAVGAALLALDGVVSLIRKADPFPPSVFDTEEGRKAFVESYVRQLPRRYKR